MDAFKIMIFAVSCVLLGIIGGIVARSFLAGIVLGVFVFVGWFLWRLFQLQNEKDGLKQDEISKQK
jgi:MFS superfamily sulfate permease-like transporter